MSRNWIIENKTKIKEKLHARFDLLSFPPIVVRSIFAVVAGGTFVLGSDLLVDQQIKIAEHIGTGDLVPPNAERNSLDKAGWQFQ